MTKENENVRDFHQTVYNDALRNDMRALVSLAIREDNDVDGDITSKSLIPESAPGRAAVVARGKGVADGLVFAQ